jgi:hypothetical protein
MMRKQIRRTCRIAAPFLSLFFFLGPVATGQASLLQAIQTQTVSGQDFSFNFAGLAPSDGTGGVLTIRARGDYDAGTAGEFLTWDLDFMGIGVTAGPAIGGATIIQEHEILNDTEWTQSFTINGSDLFTALTDEMITISVDLNFQGFSGVACCFPNTGTPFVEVALQYRPVPEPTAALLFVVGFGTVARSCTARARRTRDA